MIADFHGFVAENFKSLILSLSFLHQFASSFGVKRDDDYNTDKIRFDSNPFPWLFKEHCFPLIAIVSNFDFPFKKAFSSLSELAYVDSFDRWASRVIEGRENRNRKRFIVTWIRKRRMRIEWVRLRRKTGTQNKSLISIGYMSKRRRGNRWCFSKNTLNLRNTLKPNCVCECERYTWRATSTCLSYFPLFALDLKDYWHHIIQNISNAHTALLDFRK